MPLSCINTHSLKWVEKWITVRRLWYSMTGNTTTCMHVSTREGRFYAFLWFCAKEWCAFIAAFDHEWKRHHHDAGDGCQGVAMQLSWRVFSHCVVSKGILRGGLLVKAKSLDKLFKIYFIYETWKVKTVRTVHLSPQMIWGHIQMLYF